MLRIMVLLSILFCSVSANAAIFEVGAVNTGTGSVNLTPANGLTVSNSITTTGVGGTVTLNPAA